MPAKGWRKPVEEVKEPAPDKVLLCHNCQEVIRECRSHLLDPERQIKVVSAKTFRRRVVRILTEMAHNRKGVMSQMPEEFAIQLRRVPDRMAAIVAQTYAVKGDAATLSDDEAVGMMRDLLLELDEQIIERNKNKRLPRR